MYVDSVTIDDLNELYNYGTECQISQWNGRVVQELDKNTLPSHLSTYLKDIRPMMSGGNLTGGVSYSEKEGLKVELKVKAKLGPSKDEESKSSEPENANSTNTQAELNSQERD